MKAFIKHYSLYFLILFSLFLTSCKPEVEIVPEILLAKEEIVFAQTSGANQVAIKTNLPWTGTSSQSWCAITPASGEAGTMKINIAVSENNTYAPREAIVTISVGELVKQIKVTQELIKITIETKEYKLSSPQTDIVVNIQASQAYSTTIRPDWITLKSTSSDSKMLTFTVAENNGTNTREGFIKFTSGIISDSVKVIQTGNTISIPADATGMSSTAVQLAAKIKAGFNIGNTLEAIGSENAWGNPNITEDYIKLIKKSGYNAVRLPCSWNQYADQTTHIIRPSWLARVKEVVQYCVKNDIYVMVNTHWDGGWLENNCTVAKEAENNIKQKAYWEQIAVTLRDFDEHVLFASANEPNVANATEMGVLLSYHQTFINAVRSTGGRNAYRVLVVQGPSTDIEKTNSLMNTMPTDNVPNRLMAEIHYYTPWNFCGMEKDESWGKMAYYWGKDYHSTTDTAHNSTWGEESTVDSFFDLMKKKFVDKGIPVIVGEYGAIRRDYLTGSALTLHLASRAFYLKYVTKKAIASGLMPFYWDAGGSTGVFNRNTNTVADQQSLNALIQGITE